MSTASFKLAELQQQLDYRPTFYTNQANSYFSELQNNLDWQQQTVKVYGRTHNAPRLNCFYGDAGVHYSYSGLTHIAEGWPPLLAQLRDDMQNLAQTPFNTVLGNYYRNGQDTQGWHADNEKELGQNPVVASISFGAQRDFIFKHNQDKTVKATFSLPHGSVLIMAGSVQHQWQHALPRRTKISTPRINLTFRQVC